MKIKMKMIQKGVPEDIKPYENAKKFINSELVRLDSLIDILEQIVDLIYEFGVDAETFQSSRVEQYRKLKDSVPEEFIGLFHSSISVGAGLSLENLQSSFEKAVKQMKELYRNLLELKISIEELEDTEE